MKKLLVLMLVMLNVNPGFSSEREFFDDKDNGGDGYYQNDGSIELRDFTQAEEFIEDNAKFLTETNGFKDLILELLDVDQNLAIQVWEDLVKATIWTTDQKLNLLNGQNTSYYSKQPDVQIAIRNNNEILISTKAFNKSDKAYLLLHEALHGLAGGQGPMQHIKVWNLVRYIKKNRGNLSKKQIAKRIERFSNVRNLYSKNYIDPVTLKFLINMDHENDINEYCGIYSLLYKASWSYDIPTTFINTMQPKLLKCREINYSISDGLEKEYPLTANLLRNKEKYYSSRYFSYDTITSEREVYHRWSNRHIKKIVFNHCLQYTNPANQVERDNITRELEEIVLEKKTFMQEGMNSNSLFIRSLHSLITTKSRYVEFLYIPWIKENYLENNIKEIEEYSRIHYENIEECNDVFGRKFKKERRKLYSL